MLNSWNNKAVMHIQGDWHLYNIFKRYDSPVIGFYVVFIIEDDFEIAFSALKMRYAFQEQMFVCI